jgi:hypothetical protein
MRTPAREHPEPVEGCGSRKLASFDRLRMLAGENDEKLGRATPK